MRICHFLVLHRRDDERIVFKEAVSAANNGNDVTVLVADGLGNSRNGNLSIIDIGKVKGSRVSRSYAIFCELVRIDADIYQFHDPELLPWAFIIHARGRRVVYDVHEDVPVQILSKPWIPRLLRKPISFLFNIAEKSIAKSLSGIVAATPYIARKFQRYNKSTVVINNYPLRDEFLVCSKAVKDPRKICYVGGITRERGIVELLDAMQFVHSGAKLYIAGTILDDDLERKVKNSQNVVYLGYLDRAALVRLYSDAALGLVTLHPLPNYKLAQPVKLYEYLSAGLCVLASDFPEWQKLVNGNGIGLCVDPLNVQAIASAIDSLVTDSMRIQEMGKKGRQIIETAWNWESEATTLLAFYEYLIGPKKK